MIATPNCYYAKYSAHQSLARRVRRQVVVKQRRPMLLEHGRCRPSRKRRLLRRLLRRERRGGLLLMLDRRRDAAAARRRLADGCSIRIGALLVSRQQRIGAQLRARSAPTRGSSGSLPAGGAESTHCSRRALADAARAGGARTRPSSSALGREQSTHCWRLPRRRSASARAAARPLQEDLRSAHRAKDA